MHCILFILFNCFRSEKYKHCVLFTTATTIFYCCCCWWWWWRHNSLWTLWLVGSLIHHIEGCTYNCLQSEIIIWFSFQKLQFLFRAMASLSSSPSFFAFARAIPSRLFSCSLSWASCGIILIWRITWCNGMWNWMQFEWDEERVCFKYLFTVCFTLIENFPIRCGKNSKTNKIQMNVDRKFFSTIVIFTLFLSMKNLSTKIFCFSL